MYADLAIAVYIFGIQPIDYIYNLFLQSDR